MPQKTASKLGLFQRFFNLIPLLIIKFYRACISPLFPPSCRFEPSCSAYGLKAFQNYPLPKAVLLTIWRILRCNPFSPGGYDPLAPPKTRRKKAIRAGLLKPQPHLPKPE